MNLGFLPMVLLIGAAVAPFIGIVGDQYGRRKILLICLFHLSLWAYLWIFSLKISGYYYFSRAMQGVWDSFPFR